MENKYNGNRLTMAQHRFGEDVAICRINITWEDHIPRNVTVYISDDGIALKSWIPITLSLQEHFCIENDAFARYIKIVMNQNLGSTIGIKQL
jgi:hypothetical protein